MNSFLKSGIAQVQEKKECIDKLPDEDGAIRCFEKLRGTRKADPEVLTYQSNLLAKQKQSPQSPLYTIAVAASLNQDAGINILQGVAQVQKQAIEDGGINLYVVVANDMNDQAAAKAVASELVKRTEILAVVGHYTSEVTKATLETYNNYQLTVISPTSVATNLRQGNDIFFRTVSSTQKEAEWLVRYAKNQRTNPRIAVFYSKGKTYSDSLFSEFQTALKGKGTIVDPVVDLATMDTSSPDWKENLNQHLENIDFIALFPDGKTQNSDAFDNTVKLINNSQKPILGGNALYVHDIVQQAGIKASCRLFIPVDWAPGQGDSNINRVVSNTWGGDSNHRTALSYDATTAVWEALKKAIGAGVTGNNRAAIDMRKWLPQVDFNGMTGNVKFAKNGDRQDDPSTRTYVTIIPNLTQDQLKQDQYKYSSLTQAQKSCHQ